MWSLLHDIVVAFGLGTHLLFRWLRGRFRGDPSINEYVAYRNGRRIGELKNDGRPLIWFHGVSVGEVAGLDGVIAAIRQQTNGSVAIAVSTMTGDGLRAAQRLANQPDSAFIYPLDFSFFARRVVARLTPRALVIFDGDFWFQMLSACHRTDVPVMVINGKLSERSARNYARFPSYSKRMFSRIVMASVQSGAMADRFARCFVPRDRISVDGNLKLDFATPTSTPKSAERFCFVFGSIHPEELDSIADPIRRILASNSRVQIAIAPRHPGKFTRGVIDKYFPGILTTWIDDDNSSAPDSTPLIWVNRLGVLRELYGTAHAAFVGGTFCDVGGHNLAEPAQFGLPALYGPHVHSQLSLHEMLKVYGAARQVRTPDELYEAMCALIDHDDARLDIARGIERLRKDSAGLAARVAGRILNLTKLDEPGVN